MTTKTYAGTNVELNPEGFLVKPEQWTPEIAIAIAKELDIVLSDAHWKVINYVREDTKREGQSPGPRRVTANAGVTMKELYALFPKGPGKLVARVAGVAKPKACI